MAVPKVYRSSDPGAPVIGHSTAGSALAVLRACLVDGYGSKSPAGWTEEFTDAPNHTAVFRNSTASGGTGCYVRVDDRIASGNPRPVEITTYASMSDVDTGYAPTPPRYVFRRPGHSNNDVSWFVVATDKTFWINIWQAGATFGGAGGAGDAISYVAADAYRYFAAGGTDPANRNVTWLGANTGVNSTTDGGLSFARDHTGITGPVGYGPLVRWSAANLGGGGYPTSPSPVTGKDACAPYHLTRPDGIRGHLPGIIIPLFDTRSLAYGSTRSDLVGSGSECLLMRAGVSDAAVYVETALDWGD